MICFLVSWAITHSSLNWHKLGSLFNDHMYTTWDAMPIRPKKDILFILRMEAFKKHTLSGGMYLSSLYMGELLPRFLGLWWQISVWEDRKWPNWRPLPKSRHAEKENVWGLILLLLSYLFVYLFTFFLFLPACSTSVFTEIWRPETSSWEKTTLWRSLTLVSRAIFTRVTCMWRQQVVYCQSSGWLWNRCFRRSTQRRVTCKYK